MDFIEVTINTSCEAVEIVTAALISLGISGMQIEDDNEINNLLKNSDWDYVDESLLKKEVSGAKIKIYLTDDICGEETVLSVKNSMELLKQMDLGVSVGDLTVELTNVNDEQWLNNWKKYYKPFEVGEKIVIKPEWEEYENNSGKIVFNINPGLAFGTGLHQTTQLCITQLEKYVTNEVEVIDIGCGSGILSVISLLLGARRVFAVDIDTNAVRAASENLMLNGLATDKCKITLGNILTDSEIKKDAGCGYNIVVANIVADAVIEISKIVSELLVPGGIFITSGIITERLNDVYDALKENKLTVLETQSKDDWICVICRNSL